jgi:hypothetical protein
MLSRAEVVHVRHDAADSLRCSCDKSGQRSRGRFDCRCNNRNHNRKRLYDGRFKCSLPKLRRDKTGYSRNVAVRHHQAGIKVETPSRHIDLLIISPASAQLDGFEAMARARLQPISSRLLKSSFLSGVVYDSVWVSAGTMECAGQTIGRVSFSAMFWNRGFGVIIPCA